MATNTERLRIFENIMARTGMNKETLVEFAKAMSSLNGLQTYTELNPPQPVLNAPQAPMTPQTTPSATPQESGLNMPLNTPTEGM